MYNCAAAGICGVSCDYFIVVGGVRNEKNVTKILWTWMTREDEGGKVQMCG